MTFKQWMRRLFSDLWHRCGRLAEDKMKECSYHSPNHAEWWENFIERCDKRALKHAEFVPGKYDEQRAARPERVQGAQSE